MSCVDQAAGESWLASPLSKRVLRSLRSRPTQPTACGGFSWDFHGFHGIFMGDTWYLKYLKRGCNIFRWNNIIFNHLYAIFRYVNLLESTSCHWKRGMLQGYASITVDGYDVSFFTPSYLAFTLPVLAPVRVWFFIFLRVLSWSLEGWFSVFFFFFSQSLGSMIYGLNGAIIFRNLPNGFIIPLFMDE